MKIPEDLYRHIVANMPIPCVDLLIRNKLGHILLLKRRNSPAKNQWWFPGGRVLFNETLERAAHRKAKQECGLKLLENVFSRGTYELFFCENGASFHSITTLFECKLSRDYPVALDAQSEDYIWLTPAEFYNINLHEFISESISKAIGAEKK
jgi:colanic acid biosynthesis protein WcaH